MPLVGGLLFKDTSRYQTSSFITLAKVGRQANGSVQPLLTPRPIPSLLIRVLPCFGVDSWSNHWRVIQDLLPAVPGQLF